MTLWDPYLNGTEDGGGGYFPGTGPNFPAPPLVGPPAAPSPAAAGGGGGGQGGGGAAGGSLITKPMFDFRDAPEFHAPRFAAPTFADAQNTPGYQFRLAGGADALERSAAARGVARTGGTLKDITEYGQNFASQEYGNVYERALQAYDRDYRAALGEFTPQFDEWRFLSAAEQQAAMAQWQLQMRNVGGGGGGGGDHFAQDVAAAPPDPGAPDGLIKPTHPYWNLNPNNPYNPNRPHGQGELWPERF